MSAIDFPDNPTEGDIFTAPSGISWVFNDPVWRLVGSDSDSAGSDGFTFVQDTEPTATATGQTWFDTSTGDSFVWVVDADSSQWVQFAPGNGVEGNGLLVYVMGDGVDASLAAGAIIPGLTTGTAVQFKAGRTYRVTASWNGANVSGPGDVLQTVGLRLDSNEVIAKTVTLHGVGSWLYTQVLEYVFVPPVDVEYVVNAYSQTTSFYVGSFNRRGILQIEDVTPGAVGPVGPEGPPGADPGRVGAIFLGNNQAVTNFVGLSWLPAAFTNDPNITLNGNVITFAQGGTYAVSASASGAVALDMLVGPSIITSGPFHPATGWATASGVFSFAPGDTLTVRGWSSAAATATTPRLEIWRLGAP